MCGIAGIVQRRGRRRYGRDDVRRMTDRIVHRGPDDDGIYANGEVILGMRRLSIIDLAGGHQPISNEDDTVWVVNNGEIYNYQALRRELERKGHTFRTQSDTEVLVHLYEEHGDEFLNRLEGMFALALWDTKRARLLIARDRLGIKPVYLWKQNGMLAFASEVKSFLTLPSFSADVSHEALASHIGIGFAIAPDCIFNGVEKLAPASYLVWQEGDCDIRRYWSIPGECDTSRDYGDWVEAVRTRLREAVSSHMVADVPIGSFLSGGIDSSAIATLMRNSGDSQVNTYSIGYSGSSVAEFYNELPFARQVADSIGSQHREISVKPSVATLLPRLIWHLEEPNSDSAIMTTYLVAELAAKSVKVILSGIGGDELFAGYTRHLGSHYDRLYSRIPAWLRKSALPRLGTLLPSGRQNAFLDKSRLAKRFIEAGRLDPGSRYAYYLAIADKQVCARLLEGAGNGAMGRMESLAGNERSADDLLRYLRIDWQSQLAENLLLLTDKLTMACSLECRVPFLDHKLVELAASVPAAHKMPGGRLKGLLKDAVAPILPESIVARGKRGFGAPVGAWFKRELDPVIRYLLRPEVINARGLFDANTVATIRDAHARNRQDYTDLILVLLNVEIWARMFIDGMSYQELGDELAHCTTR